MVKIRNRIINENTNVVTLFTSENNIYIVTPDNIDETIRCISNISVFLTDSNHSFDYGNRNFDF